MGVDEAVAAEPSDFFKDPPPRPPKPVAAETAAPSASRDAAPKTAPLAASAAPSADEAIAKAAELAKSCDTFAALVDAIAAFDGCPLKAGARNTVISDGTEGADLLVIGEAPGREEDRLGKPFVGRAGQLLDRMLAAIGRSRDADTLITNVVFWRPPGNRAPTAVETAICRPFVDRLITLTKPRAIMLAGGAPTQAMLGVSGIMRARGAWRELETSEGAIPVLPMLHPAFLLRQPAQKKLAWRDLLSLRAKLEAD